jgi:predicted enzyme related to lactoylglutathione lyase
MACGFLNYTHIGISPAIFDTFQPSNIIPATKAFQSAIHKPGIPSTAFAVEDIQKKYERMKKLGAVFTTGPTKMGPVTIVVFDDTCGNLIQRYQEAAA